MKIKGQNSNDKVRVLECRCGGTCIRLAYFITPDLRQASWQKINFEKPFILKPNADVVELADTPDSKSGAVKSVRVQVPPSALAISN